jgi:hypothetical protein
VTAGEGRAELAQLRAQAPVEDEVADLGDEAAEQRRLDLDLERDLAAEPRAQRATQAFLLRLGERARAAHLRALHAGRLVGEARELGADRLRTW